MDYLAELDYGLFVGPFALPDVLLGFAIVIIYKYNNSFSVLFSVLALSLLLNLNPLYVCLAVASWKLLHRSNVNYRAAYRPENWINRTGRLMDAPINRNRSVNRSVYYCSENILVNSASIL